MFKEDFCVEKYLSLPKLTSYQRFSLVKFRCGSNKLPINKFKFSRIVEDIANIYHETDNLLSKNR